MPDHSQTEWSCSWITTIFSSQHLFGLDSIQDVVPGVFGILDCDIDIDITLTLSFDSDILLDDGR